MQDALIEFGIGAFTGGLSVSASWGLLWLVVGLMGFSRGTCSWRVVLNSLRRAWLLRCGHGGILWWYDGVHGVSGNSPWECSSCRWFVELGIASGSRWSRAVKHMLDGVRPLMDHLLGKHRSAGMQP